MYFAVTDPSFPDDVCTKFLRQISTSLYERYPDFKRDPQNIIALNTDAKLMIHDLHSKYKDNENVAMDKTSMAQNAINMATNVMRDNLGAIIGNQRTMMDIESKSSDIRDTASRFRE